MNLFFIIVFLIYRMSLTFELNVWSINQILLFSNSLYISVRKNPNLIETQLKNIYLSIEIYQKHKSNIYFCIYIYCILHFINLIKSKKKVESEEKSTQFFISTHKKIEII